MQLSSVHAFIFDIDGTLVDSNELHVDSWDRAFQRFGKQFSREQLRAQIGKGDDNKPSVLASSGKKTDTKYYIDLLKVGDLIDGYVSGDDADSSKPAPDIFAASLEKLGDISPADAVTVGDTRFDVEAARRAGLKTIAFLCGGTAESILRRAGAIAIYHDPADFLARYKKLVAHAAASQT